MTSEVDGLEWLSDAYADGFAVVFVRGVEARELLLRLGCPEESLALLTREDAEEQELDDEDGGHVIRAGTHGGWAFAVQRWGARVLEEDVIPALSSGTELVALVKSSLPWFAYAAKGEQVCAFDAGMPHIRHGSDPDRFLTLMGEAGVLRETRPEGVRPVDAMLRLAELAFGLSLPRREIESGELAAGVVED